MLGDGSRQFLASDHQFLFDLDPSLGCRRQFLAADDQVLLALDDGGRQFLASGRQGILGFDPFGDGRGKLPVVFDERTSRLPTPWLLRLEGLEGQQRLYLSHLLRTKAPENQLPPPPEGGQWVGEKALATMDIVPGVRRLCQSALSLVKEL